MMETILKRLSNQESLIEVFKNHPATAVIGEGRLPDDEQLCRRGVGEP